MVDDAPLDDHVGLGKSGVEVAAAKRPVADLVGPELLVDQRSAGDRRLGVGHDRQRVVLDDHVLGGVDDRVAVGADDQRNGVAHVLDRVLGEHPMVRGVDLDSRRDPGHRQPGLHVEIGVRVDRDHADALLGR